MSITDEQMARLPKYAQQEIELLRGSLANERKRIAAIGEQTAADVYPHWAIDQYSDQPIILADGSQISAVFGPHWADELDVKFTLRDGQLGLEISGSDRLVVLPHAANVIQIKAKGGI